MSSDGGVTPPVDFRQPYRCVSIGQGVDVLTFKEQLAKVKSSHELLSATWPGAFAPDARDAFDNAIKGWDLALELWAGRVAKLDDPTEPNINGYATYMDYAGNVLKTDVWSTHTIVEAYRGRKRIRHSDENVSILVTVAAAHSKVGKSKVLAAMSEVNEK